MENRPRLLALAFIAFAIMGLLLLGVRLLLLPKLFLIARPMLMDEAFLFIGLAVLLAWFRDWMAEKLLWLCMELHRLLSALLMLAVAGAEGFMHLFNIPHLEGWWIPLLGGGMVTAIGAWLQLWKRRWHGR